MTFLKNDTFLRALRRQPTPYTPIWIMRQAGRYLPEYNATRKRAGNFLTLCKTPELATEVTLQPIDRYSLDAAIIFSDILTIPDAMGLGLYFVEGEGPKFERPLRDESAIKALQVPEPEAALGYVMEAISMAVRALDGRVPLIGFSGSPYTLACYMIEGGGSDDFRRVKTMLYDRPDLLHHILDINANAVARYLKAQIKAGAQALMIFDTWGGSLSHRAYHEFSLPYMQKIVAALKADAKSHEIPVILFTKGGGLWLESLAGTGCDALGLDWTMDLAAARKRVGEQVALQGNLDPNTLFAAPEQIHREVARALAEFGAGHGHVFNLGHGISQHTPPERVTALVAAVHDLSAPYH
ncbi:MAG: uroporphyrinogen decarboxylase [Burkholderiales bacterium]